MSQIGIMYMAIFDFKKIILYNIIFILIFSGIIFWYNEQSANNSSVDTFYYPKIEVHCIDILKAGALYSGQPLCGQPPLSYYAGYLLSSLFSEDNIHISTFIVMILLSGIMLTFLTIYLQLNGFKEFLLLSVFSAFFLSIAIINFATLLSTFFIFWAFFSFKKGRIFTSGLLFALSLSSKVTSLIFLPIFMLMILYSQRNIHTLYKTSLKKIAVFTCPIILLTLFFYLRYPLIYDYIFTSHTILNPEWSFSNALISMFENFDIQIFIISFMFFLGITMIIRFKKYDCLFLLPLPFLYIKLTNLSAMSHIETGQPAFPPFTTYYFTIFFPFLLITVIEILRKAQNANVYRILQISFMLFIIYFGTHNTDSVFNGIFDKPSVEKQNAIGKISYFYTTLTYDSELIFADKHLFNLIPKQYRDKFVILNNTFILDPTELEYVDPIHGRGIALLLTYNKSAFNPAFMENQKKYVETYNSTYAQLLRKPSMIFVSLIYWPNPFILALREQPLNSVYCIVYIPALSENRNGRHSARAYYNNQMACNNAIKSTHNFISSNFDYFCNFDELVANYYIKIIQYKHLPFNKHCISGKNGFKNYQSTFVPIAITALFVTSTILIIFKKRNQIK